MPSIDRNSSARYRFLSAPLAALLLTAAPISAQTITGAGKMDAKIDTASVRAKPTGEYVNGVPVYRLPTVNVVASRKAELAKMQAEERLALLQPPVARRGKNAKQSTVPAAVAAK